MPTAVRSEEPPVEYQQDVFLANEVRQAYLPAVKVGELKIRRRLVCFDDGHDPYGAGLAQRKPRSVGWWETTTAFYTGLKWSPVTASVPSVVILPWVDWWDATGDKSGLECSSATAPVLSLEGATSAV